MYHCRFRALTEQGEPFYFTARDVPVAVYPDRFVLANCPGTPVLNTGSICRTMDHLPLGEGDSVLVEGLTYKVTYCRGFSLLSAAGTYLLSDAIPAYSFVSMGMGDAPEVLCKYKDFVFRLSAFLGCVDGKAVISGSGTLASLEEIQVSAGFRHDRRKIFYGDTIDGCEVIMWRGRPCVKKAEGYIEVPSGRFLGGVG